MILVVDRNYLSGAFQLYQNLRTGVADNAAARVDGIEAHEFELSFKFLADRLQGDCPAGGLDGVPGDFLSVVEKIAEQANHNKLTTARSEAERKLMTSVLEGQTFPLPESVVKAQQEEYENEVREYLSQQGLEKEAVDETVKNMGDDSRKQAEERARIQLFLTALARREKIEVTAQEVDMQIMQMARQYNQDFHKLREALYQNGAVNDIQDRMVNSKAMNLMFDKAQKVAPAEAKAE